VVHTLFEPKIRILGASKEAPGSFGFEPEPNPEVRDSEIFAKDQTQEMEPKMRSDQFPNGRIAGWVSILFATLNVVIQPEQSKAYNERQLYINQEFECARNRQHIRKT
jgi:hypothetical protein